MNNLGRPSNARGRSTDNLYTTKSVITDSLKRGESQTFGQQHIPEFPIEQPWGDLMDPLWQQDRHWSMDNLHENSVTQSNPSAMELGLFPLHPGQQARAYSGENGGAQGRLGPIDLSDEGKERRIPHGVWPTGDPSQRETVAWYTSQIALNPSIVGHEVRKVTPPPKPSKRAREVHIPRASQNETIATTLQEESDKPFKCERCPARFARKRDCERHGRSVHTGSKLYYCKGCGDGFVRSDARGRHWKLNPECHQFHLQTAGSSNRSSPSA